MIRKLPLFKLIFTMLGLTLFIGWAPIQAIDLNGAYNIGTSGTSDYSTITDAINDLKAGSILGDITYHIEAGTYYETIDLSSISNGDFSISFIGENKATTIIHPLDSIVSSKSGILIEATNNVVMKNLTLVMDDISDSEVSSLENETKGISVEQSSNITFDNIDFYLATYGGKDGTELICSSLSLFDVQNIVVDSCSFSGAIFHIWLDDFDHVDITNNTFERGYDHIKTDLSVGSTGNVLLIQNNHFDTPVRYGVNVIGEGSTLTYTYITNVDIQDNQFEHVSNSSIQVAIRTAVLDGATIAHNVIHDGFHGIEVHGSSGVTIESNEIYASAYPLHLSAVDSSITKNNFMKSATNVTANLENNTDLYFINNTLQTDNIYEHGVGDQNLKLIATRGKAIILNNIFVNTNPLGTEIYFSGSNLDSLVVDYNLYASYATEPFFVAGGHTVKGVSIPTGDYTLSSWQAAFSLDANSQSFDPEFVSTSDFHITNATDYRFGEYWEENTTDIDGELRLESVGIDVGADQFCTTIEESLDVIACTSYIFNGKELNESGQYVAELVAANGCDSVVTLNLTIDPLEPSCIELITGLANVENSILQVGPNPTSGNFTLHLSSLESDFTIDVYNLQGELIYSNAFQNTHSVTGQLEGPAGLYLIKYSSATRNETLRIVKE